MTSGETRNPRDPTVEEAAQGGALKTRSRNGAAATSQLERHVTLQQLRIFKSVVDERNFTRAAEALYLTQPAVTHQIQALARSTGQALFKGPGPLGLTPLGELVYQKACNILADLRELDDAVEDLGHLRSGSVRVAGDVTFGTYILPRAIGAFRNIHPDVRINLAVAQGSSIRDLLIRRETDIGIVGRLWEDDRIASEEVMQNVVSCFCAPTHPLAHQSAVGLQDLSDHVLLVREPGSGLSQGVKQLFAERGRTMRPAMEIADNEARKRAAIEGLGVAVLSTYAVHSELAVGLLVPVNVEGFPLHLTWHAVWLKSLEPAPPALAFRRFLCSEAWTHKAAPNNGHRSPLA